MEVVSKTHSSPFLSTSPFACESDRWRQSVEHLGKGGSNEHDVVSAPRRCSKFVASQSIRRKWIKSTCHEERIDETYLH
eukprot:3493554-Amphidinium_carterae.1